MSLDDNTRDEVIEVAPFPSLNQLQGFYNAFQVGNRIVAIMRDGRLVEYRDGELHWLLRETDQVPGIFWDGTEFADGDLLVSTNDNGLFLVRNGKIEAWKNEANRFCLGSGVRGIRRLTNDQYVVTTDSKGFILFDREGRIIDRFDANHGLSSEQCIGWSFEDDAGNVWVPFGGGAPIVRLSGRDRTRRLKLSGDNLRWIRMHNQQIYASMDMNLFRLESVDDSGLFRTALVREKCWSDEALHLGNELVLATRLGLAVIRDGELITPDQKETYGISLAATADQQHVFMGSANSRGIQYFQHDGKEWRHVRRLVDSVYAPNALVVDPTDTALWFVEGNRYAVCHPSRIELEPGSENVIRPGKRTSYEGTSCVMLGGLKVWNGRVLFGGENGLFEFDPDENRFRSFRSLNSGMDWLSERGIDCLEVDSAGCLWVATNSQELVRLFPEGQADWPVGIEAATRIRRVSADPEGRAVWLITAENYVIRCDAEATPKPISNAGVKLRRVVLAGRSWLPGEKEPGAPSLTRNGGPVEFQYSCISADRLPSNPYQYRLVGVSDQWSDWTDESEQVFRTLPKGRFRFEVRVRDRHFVPSETSSFAFSVVPPWYQTTAMYVVYSIMLLGVFYMAAMWRLRNVRRSMRQLESEVARRQSIEVALRDEMQEKKSLQQSLIQSQKLEAIGTLAAGVAHDFNNSLAAIVNFAEVTGKGLPADSKEVEYVKHILDAAKQAAGTTNGLLTFSGEKAGEKFPKNLGRLLDQSVKFLRRVIPSSIELSNHYDGATIYCDIDESQIKQVLMNLVVNARDAMPDGGEVVIALNSNCSEPGFVLLTVSDTGTGMSHDVKESIFDPFYTTKERGQGTGLGMSIVHGIIEEHGGAIEVESEVGHGTTIKILLPVSRSAERELQRHCMENVHGEGQMVLLAEDNDSVRKAIRIQLQRAGFSVIDVRDGQEALIAFKEHAELMRLVLLDIDLPKQDGHSCLKEIRELSPDVPAILMSGMPMSKPERCEIHPKAVRRSRTHVRNQ